MNEHDNFDGLVYILDEVGISYLYTYQPIKSKGIAKISEHLFVPILNMKLEKIGNMFTVSRGMKTDVFMNTIAFEHINDTIHMCNKQKRIAIRIPLVQKVNEIDTLLERVKKMAEGLK